MKLISSELKKRDKKSPDAARLWRGFRRRRQKWGSEIRESQRMDTDLKVTRDLSGRRTRISTRRSSFSATSWADRDGVSVGFGDVLGLLVEAIDGQN